MPARPEPSLRRIPRPATAVAPPYRGPDDLQFRPNVPLDNQTVETLIEGALELLRTAGAAFEVGSRAGYFNCGRLRRDRGRRGPHAARTGLRSAWQDREISTTLK